MLGEYSEPVSVLVEALPCYDEVAVSVHGARGILLVVSGICINPEFASLLNRFVIVFLCIDLEFSVEYLLFTFPCDD